MIITRILINWEIRKYKTHKIILFHAMEGGIDAYIGWSFITLGLTLGWTNVEGVALIYDEVCGRIVVLFVNKLESLT